MNPSPFQFSQGTLQDYVDCPRRFQLRYMQAQPWPAHMTDSPEHAEQHAERGARLHHLLHQHTLGLETGILESTLNDPILAQWWRTYLQRPPSGLPSGLRLPEVVLSASLGQHRLIARLDLVAVEPGRRAVIVDWKTPLRRPSRVGLLKRLQTRVYRYLAVEAACALTGGTELEPEQVEMIYWFATFGGDVERFPYDRAHYAADRKYLRELVAEIDARQDRIWPMTHEKQRCRFCNYRSLCEQDVRAGSLEESDEDAEPRVTEVDLDQIAEIAF